MATRTRYRGYTRPARLDPARIEDSVGVPLDDVDADVQGLYDMRLQGPLSERPGAGVERRVFYATDTRTWHYDTGSAWETIGAVVEPAIIVGSGGSAPAFGAGWGHAPADVLGTPTQVRFWRHGTRVHLAGTGRQTGGSRTTMFTLPAGYRPAGQVRAICYVNPSGFVPSYGVVMVDPTGLIYDIDGTQTVSLDGISFDTAR